MNADELMKKAGRAVASARLLLADGDIEGACNRSYYAMFDAAHAALLTFGITTDPRSIRRHQTVISLFGLHLVAPGHLPKELGRSLNKAEEIRLLADYTGDDIDLETAAWVVGQAEFFIAAVLNYLPTAPKVQFPTDGDAA